MFHWFLIPALLALVLFPAGWASAYSTKVEAAFKGQIIISKDPLEAKANDAATIAWFKTQKITKLNCVNNTDGTASTRFHVTAFPSSPTTAPTLDLKFVETSNPGQTGHSATKTLTGLQTGVSVVENDVQLSSDDIVGPHLKITLQQGPARTALASTEIEASCLKKPQHASQPKVQPPKKHLQKQ